MEGDGPTTESDSAPTLTDPELRLGSPVKYFTFFLLWLNFKKKKKHQIRCSAGRGVPLSPRRRLAPCPVITCSCPDNVLFGEIVTRK